MKKQKKQPQLESQNLILYPLLPEQMNLLRDDPNELCRSLSLVPDDYAKYGEWVMLAEEQYRKMMADQEYMSFYTLWIITEKEDKHLVGYLYFLGRPSDTEAVELNGFIKPAYRRKGYMTEALNTLRGWAFANKSVTIMLAHPQRDDEIFHGLLRKEDPRYGEGGAPAGPWPGCCGWFGLWNQPMDHRISRRHLGRCRVYCI